MFGRHGEHLEVREICVKSIMGGITLTTVWNTVNPDNPPAITNLQPCLAISPSLHPYELPPGLWSDAELILALYTANVVLFSFEGVDSSQRLPGC